MLSNRFTKLLLLALTAVLLSVSSRPITAQAEIIDLDLSGIVVAFNEGDPGLTLANAQRYVAALRRGEAFWDARVLGYSNTLPLDVQGRLNGSLLISVANQEIGGGILGFAGFNVDGTTIVDIVRGDFIRRRQVSVGRFAIMVLDNEFIRNNTDDDITDVVIHEMGHALGVGTLWQFNDLIQRVGRVGPEQYVGENARRAYAIETRVAGRARTGFVPAQQVGGGMAGGHWDGNDPFFNSAARNRRVELMTPFFIPDTERFISRTTLASLVDLHYVVKGFNEDELIQYPRQLANRFIPPTPVPVDAIGRLSGFNSNPFGANEALKKSGSGAAIKRGTPANLYKKRRK